MKKLLKTALIFVLAIALCSCGAKVPAPEEVRGSISGSVYTNDYLGISFTNPDGWEFMTEAEIEEITGISQDIVQEGGVDVEYDYTVYDMMSSDKLTGNNINFMIQIVKDDGTLDYDELLDETEQEILEMGGAIGMNYSFKGHSTVKLSGITFHKTEADVEYYGITFEQGCYIAVEDSVLCNLTITSYDGTPLSDIEAAFN